MLGRFLAITLVRSTMDCWIIPSRARNSPSEQGIPTDEVEIQHSLACFGLQSVDKGAGLRMEQGVFCLGRPRAGGSGETADVVIGRGLLAMRSGGCETGRRHLEGSSL